MEFAMMDKMIAECNSRGIKRIIGYYYPTAKNGMVRDFYDLQGFTKVSESEKGDIVFELVLDEKKEGFSDRGVRNKVIVVE